MGLETRHRHRDPVWSPGDGWGFLERGYRGLVEDGTAWAPVNSDIQSLGRGREPQGPPSATCISHISPTQCWGLWCGSVINISLCLVKHPARAPWRYSSMRVDWLAVERYILITLYWPHLAFSHYIWKQDEANLCMPFVSPTLRTFRNPESAVWLGLSWWCSKLQCWREQQLGVRGLWLKGPQLTRFTSYLMEGKCCSF